MHTAGAGFAGCRFLAGFADIELSLGIGFAAQRNVLSDH